MTTTLVRVGSQTLTQATATLQQKYAGFVPFSANVNQFVNTGRLDYDAIMLQLHDCMKRDVEYQRVAPQASVDFPAGTTWLAFTDQVSHAAMAGQYQLEQTFLLPVEAMRDQATAPLRILERLKNRRLV